MRVIHTILISFGKSVSTFCNILTHAVRCKPVRHTPRFFTYVYLSNADCTGIELSSVERRAHVVMLQSLGWTGGMCMIPLVAWLTGDWVSFVLLPLLPTFCIFICALRYASLDHLRGTYVDGYQWRICKDPVNPTGRGTTEGTEY